MTTSRGRNALRRAAAVLTALPLAGGVLVAAAPAALADITTPGTGTTFTSNTSRVNISATFDGSLNNTEFLYLRSPGGAEVEVDREAGSTDGGTLSYGFDLDCWTGGCSGGRRLAPNGTWEIRQAGTDSDKVTFVTSIRPEPPAGVDAAALNPREVRVSWRVGAEPDLTGWAVFEGSDRVADGISRSACAGGTCSTVIGYATEGSGDHTYTVRAYRSAGPGTGSTLESAPSAPVSARLESPPPPPPSEEPSGGGSTSGGGSGGGESGGSESEGGQGGSGGQTGGGESGGGAGTSGGSGGQTSGGSGSGGSTGGQAGGSGGSTGGSGSAIGTSRASGASADQQVLAQRKAFALGFSAFGPKLGIPKLPPLPQAQAPAIAPALPDGTYEPTLGFEDQVLTERVPVAVAQGPTARVRNVVDGALDSERLVRSTAGAMVLLLLGAHLRRWLGAATEEH